jgi:hypothetical protein
MSIPLYCMKYNMITKIRGLGNQTGYPKTAEDVLKQNEARA